MNRRTLFRAMPALALLPWLKPEPVAAVASPTRQELRNTIAEQLNDLEGMVYPSYAEEVCTFWRGEYEQLSETEWRCSVSFPYYDASEAMSFLVYAPDEAVRTIPRSVHDY